LINGQEVSKEQQDVSATKLISSMRYLMKEAANYLPSEINQLFEEIYSSKFISLQ